MRRSSLVFGFAMLGLLAFAACDPKEEPGNVNMNNQSAKLSFAPACGKVGDAVHMTANLDFCSTKDPVVFFSPHAGKSVKTDVSVTGSARNYTLDFTVPEGAETGTLVVQCGNLLDTTTETSAVFTIGCPTSDAGTDAQADAGTPGVALEQGPPTGTEIDIYSYESKDYLTRGGRIYLTTVDKDGTLLDHASRTTKELQALLDIEKGDCVEVPTPPLVTPAPPEGVKDVNAGAQLQLIAPGQQTIPFNRNDLGDKRGYRLTNPLPIMPPYADPPVPPGVSYDLSIPGGGGIPAGTWMGVFKSAPELNATWPDQDKSGDNSFPTAGFKISYAPSNAQLMTITFGSETAKTRRVCRLDPSAREFLITQALFESAKAARGLNDTGLVLLLTAYQYVRTTYMQDAYERSAWAVHRRMNTVSFKID